MRKARVRKRGLIFSGAATVALSIVLYVIDPHMTAGRGPTILQFEFAATSHRAARMMAEWGPEGRDAARVSLWLDYGYMLSYATFFTLAGFATREQARARSWRRLAALGTVVPFFAVAAAVFDASENVALLLTLSGRGGRWAPPFATVCSSIKFALIALAIGYAGAGLAVRLTKVLSR